MTKPKLQRALEGSKTDAELAIRLLKQFPKPKHERKRSAASFRDIADVLARYERKRDRGPDDKSVGRDCEVNPTGPKGEIT